jgi:predicted ferric reductase
MIVVLTVAAATIHLFELIAALYFVLALYALIALVVTALWRRKWNIRYEIWHLSHIILAVVAVAAGMLHMVGWSLYLTSSWKRELWIGQMIFWIGLLLYVRIIKPLFLLRRPYRITEVRQERGDAWTLPMQPDGHADFHFSAGQFGWLTVWGSPFKITGHPFSFSSSAAVTGGRVEMTIRNLGDFTSAIHKVPVGKRVYIDGPYGAFTIDRNPEADLHVLVAGGAGITPLMSMIRTLADGGDTRPVILLYGSKDWDSITFREELEALKQRIDLTIIHVLQDPPVRSPGEAGGIGAGVLEDLPAGGTGETGFTTSGALEDPWPGWTGETGYIGAGVLKRHLPPPYAEHEYFICGPNVMMDAIEKALGELGVPLWKYHSERYNFV